MRTDDLTYFTERANQERSKAEQESDPLLARVHGDMARRYEALVAELREPLVAPLSG